MAICLFFSLTFLTSACAFSRQTVLVLPFENASALPQDQWLQDGFSESLMDHLNTVENLEVVSREQLNQTCKQLETSPYVSFFNVQGAAHLGKTLQADQVILGRFQRNQDEMVIFSRAIDVRSGTVVHKYRKRIEGPKNFRFFHHVQEIAMHDLPELGISEGKLDESRKQMEPADHRTEDFKAYEYYILGRVHSFKNTEEDLRVAATYHRQAIKKDFRFGLAYVGLAQSLTAWGLIRKQKGLPFQDYYRQAHDNIRLGKKYDPQISSFHTQEMQKILDAHIDFVLGETHFENKNYEKAIAAYRQSLKIYRQDAMTLFRIGEAYDALGERNRARSFYASALEINPTFTPAMDRLEGLMKGKQGVH